MSRFLKNLHLKLILVLKLVSRFNCKFSENSLRGLTVSAVILNECDVSHTLKKTLAFNFEYKTQLSCKYTDMASTSIVLFWFYFDFSILFWFGTLGC